MRSLLVKYTGFPTCSKHALSPLMLASVWRIVCFLGLQYANIGAAAILFFTILNASWYSEPQMNGTLSLASSLIGSASSGSLAEKFDK